MAAGELRGSIPLVNVVSVTITTTTKQADEANTSNGAKHPYTFEIATKRGRVYELSANSKESAQEWVDDIQQVHVALQFAQQDSHEQTTIDEASSFLAEAPQSSNPLELSPSPSAWLSSPRLEQDAGEEATFTGPSAGMSALADSAGGTAKFHGIDLIMGEYALHKSGKKDGITFTYNLIRNCQDTKLMVTNYRFIFACAVRFASSLLACLLVGKSSLNCGC